MKPRIKLAESTTPDGGTLSLFEHDGEFSIFLDGKELMHSMVTASEEMLGTVGCERLPDDVRGRVLIGGLGLGFTLKAVFNATTAKVEVEVAELLPAVVAWNREHLSHFHGTLLEDPRVHVHTTDVGEFIRRAAPSTYDAIMLDVDNGPTAMVADNNASIYADSGIREIQSLLKPGGRLVVWSAGPDRPFEQRLKRAGFRVKTVRAKAYEGAKRASYLLFVADN